MKGGFFRQNRNNFMDHRVKFYWILLLTLVMMITTTEAMKRETSYKVLAKGWIINGKIVGENQATSSEACSLRCVVTCAVKINNKEFLIV